MLAASVAVTSPWAAVGNGVGHALAASSPTSLGALPDAPFEHTVETGSAASSATSSSASSTPKAAPDDTRAAKTLSPIIEKAIAEREAQIVLARKEGIQLLEDFLRDSPKARERETAEALFKLAELYWEDSKAQYLVKMGDYQRAVAACRQDHDACPNVPRHPPRVDLSTAQSVYDRLIREYPRFRKIDTVIYLYAFSLRDQGKISASVKYFQILLERYPRSRYLADAYMAIAEYRFYEKSDYKGALESYERVLSYPKSQLYDLALFKTAWCLWKMGDTNRSALRFKEVLDLGKVKTGKSEKELKRAAELQDQALEYLVELFTEDDSKTAQDAFEFLAQIGGKEYSRKVLLRLADTVFDQTRYERAAEAYKLLITLEPNGADAPDYQKRVVESSQLLGDTKGAIVEMKKLATDYGPQSAWAKANADRPRAVAHARQLAEEQIRTLAKTLHAEAQRNEKLSKVVDKDKYARAADAYAFYLQNFPDAGDATELRYLRADILYFKLARLEEAGNEYLLVGKTKPVGKFHKDALLQAMTSFEKLRKPIPSGPGSAKDAKREITESDRKFAEAADLYATLFPNDKEIITVIYKNGQFFFDYGDFDEAVKRFGLIIERYPDDPNAGAAGDKLLDALNRAKDYENIESWARRLKKAKAFAAKDEQERLDKLIVGSMMKAAEKANADGQFEKAAAAYQRIPKEFPQNALAPKALANAGAVFERAKRPENAVEVYRELADKYPQAPESPEALFTAARLEETGAYDDRAALLYEQFVAKFPNHKRAPEALRNAGILRQALGEHEKASRHYAEYAKKYKDRADAREIAFETALVRTQQEDWKGAASSFAAYVHDHPGDARTVEAYTREGQAWLKAGQDAKAKEALAKALLAFGAKPTPGPSKGQVGGKSGNRNNKGGKLASNNKGGKANALHGKASLSEDARDFAAEARYLQAELLFREYDRLKIQGRPKALAKVLEQKAQLLEQTKQADLDVLTFQSPEWATAALLRIGQAYEAFAKAMRQAPTPKELSADEQQVYRDELEKLTVTIEDKAIDAYKSGYKKALDIGVYNKHTQEIRQALSRLDEGNFPAEPEQRPGLRPGEPALSLVRLDEVRRDR